MSSSASTAQRLVSEHFFSALCVPDESILVVNGLSINGWRRAAFELMRIHPGDILLQGFDVSHHGHRDWLRHIGAVAWHLSQSGVSLSLGPPGPDAQTSPCLSLANALQRTRTVFRYFEAGGTPSPGTAYMPIPQAALAALLSNT